MATAAAPCAGWKKLDAGVALSDDRGFCSASSALCPLSFGRSKCARGMPFGKYAARFAPSLKVRALRNPSEIGSVSARVEGNVSGDAWGVSAEGNGSMVGGHGTENDVQVSESSSPMGLIDGGCAFREIFKIRCYEVQRNRTASIETIANLMQETACNHVLSIGFSKDGFAVSPKMKERKLIWAMTRMHIEMEKYPSWGDVIVVETWFQTVSNILAGRDWIIRSGDSNEIIGRATSLWVMMNEETRKLSRIPLDIKEEYSHFAPSPPRSAIENESNKKIEKLGDDLASFACYNLMPRRDDLDMNHHVNNVTYISWMLSSIPSYLYDNAEIEKITLEYRQECKFGDSVDSLAYFSGESPVETDVVLEEESSSSAKSSAMMNLLSSSETTELTHLLRFSTGSNKELNRGRTVWKRKSDCRI